MQIKIRTVVLCFLVVCTFWLWLLISDRQRLNEELIRLHVVANSDSPEDQSIKLQVKDAVAVSLQEALKDVSEVEEAKVWIQENLLVIQKIANEALQNAGSQDHAVVSLGRALFDTRYYDTFSLPAGVYEAFRITIGSGEGKNWWCVAFPSLCIPATTEEFAATAVAAGFSDTLNNTLIQKDGQEVRLYLLDALGKLENIFVEG